MTYTLRKATLHDCPAIEKLIAFSARELGTQDYAPEQIEGALQGAFGLDTQLIKDATYFVVEETDGSIVGCGGWRRQQTLFGGNNSTVRDSSLRNPETEPAKIRAFFVHPERARNGIGRALLAACEKEARSLGFRQLELMATLPGARLYTACGFIAAGRIDYALPSGLTIEFLPMKKILSA
jgi:N-acetylglutamate synthase-like GNAT family acetyltransferase